MAKRPINTLKGWFVTRAKPMQQQFWDWLDSFRHLDDKIGWNDLDPSLQALFNSYSPMIPLPAGTVTWAAPKGTMLRGYLIKDSGAGQAVAVRIGTSVGGNEIYESAEDIDTSNLQHGIIEHSYVIGDADTQVYFTLTAADASTLSINIYKQ